MRRFPAIYSRPELTWGVPAFLADAHATTDPAERGVHSDDARQAIAAGMDSIIVFNHGGRQVDAAVAALDVLPRVADALAGHSGFRPGSDIMKALCLDAAAVLIGRPYIWGLALAG